MDEVKKVTQANAVEHTLRYIILKLKQYGYVIDAHYYQFSGHSWVVMVKLNYCAYFDRQAVRFVIKEITDAVDRKYGVYTDVHIVPYSNTTISSGGDEG